MLEGMLQDHRDELATAALPEEMDAAMKRTTEFLKTQAAKVTIGSIDRTADGVAVEVHVENLGGHKLPTAYRSRRAWLHVVVKDARGRVVVESGALRSSGRRVRNTCWFCQSIVSHVCALLPLPVVTRCTHFSVSRSSSAC